jgi:hypothetical protein
MPRLASNKEDAQRLKQERDRRYQLNVEVKAKKKERDRLYQQRKRDQQRLRQHEDPLAQLANVITQQRYLEAENNAIEESTIIPPIIDDEYSIDMGGVVEEDGEVLENFGDDHGSGGFNDDYDGWDEGSNDNGM